MRLAGSGSPDHFIDVHTSVQTVRFLVSQIAFEAFEQNAYYKLYFMPVSQGLLSAEKVAQQTDLDLTGYLNAAKDISSGQGPRSNQA